MEALSEQMMEKKPTPFVCDEGAFETMTENDESDIIYPETDGEPMGETGFHVTAIIGLYQSLAYFFRGCGDVYVAADMLFYYEKGNPRKFKVPDVMVIKGIENYERRIFKLWEEKAPSAIFEITSKSTVMEDISKSVLYASLGVPEYYLFDPLGEYIEERLAGFRLEGAIYRPIFPDKDGNLMSEELGAMLKQEGRFLRVIDPETGKLVPTLEEEYLRAEEESRRAKEESRRAEEESRRAEEESRRAENESRRAEQEARKSARFEAKLRAMGIDPELI